MKRKTSFFCLLLCLLVGVFSCSDSNLPPEILNCVNQNFNSSKIVKVEREHDNSGLEFDILLDNGVKIEFDENNKWESIDCEKADIPVPSKMLPKQIVSYLKSEYPDQVVVGVERDIYGYELKLANRLELIFDAEGAFIRLHH